MNTNPESPGVTAADMHMLTQYGEELVDLAWQGFLRWGRGLVVVDRARAPAGMTYMHEQQFAELEPSPQMHQLLEYIQQYDPLSEVLCLIRRSPTVAQIYRWRLSDSTPTLPQRQVSVAA